MCRLSAGVVLLGLLAPLHGSAASIFLYNAGDDQQAQAAKRTYSEVDLRKSLDAERKAVAAMTAREQAAVERDQRSLRDEELVEVLLNTDNGWPARVSTRISARLGVLLGAPSGDPNAFQKFESAWIALNRNQLQFFASQYLYYLATGARTLPACPIEEKQRPSPREQQLQTTFKDIEAACGDVLEYVRQVNAAASPSSLLAIKNREIAEVQAEIGAIAKNLAGAKAALVKAIEEARKPGKKPAQIAALSAQVKGELAQLDKIAAQKSKLDPLLSKLKVEALVEKAAAQQAFVAAFLDALQGKAPADGDPAITLIADFAGLAGAAGKSAETQATALVLQNELLRLEALTYEQQVARANERYHLLKKQRAAIIDEIVFLGSAQRRLTSYVRAPPSCASAGGLYTDYSAKDTSLDCKADIAAVLAGLSNARTLGRAEYEKLEYMLLAQSYDAALDDSQIAVEKVDRLITIPLDLLAKAYGTGIRAEDLSNLINALGLSAIAARVK